MIWRRFTDGREKFLIGLSSQQRAIPQMLWLHEQAVKEKEFDDDNAKDRD